MNDALLQCHTKHRQVQDQKVPLLRLCGGALLHPLQPLPFRVGLRQGSGCLLQG